MSDPRPAPYPADTRAKGWRFELDYEQIEQSETWQLAAEVPMCQHALLMLWMIAWSKQVPCGSLPNDEAVIRAACRIPAATWPKVRAILLRGWWLADDGRLYHPTLTARVAEMMKKRRSDADRAASHRAKQERESAARYAGITPESRVTHTGVRPEFDTDHRPPNTEDKEQSAESTPREPTRAGIACRRMRTAGLQDANPAHPALLALLQAGITDDELAAAADAAVAKRKGFAYALAVAEGRRRDAAGVAALPEAPPSPEDEAERAAKAQAERTAAYLAEQEAQRAAAKSPEALKARAEALAKLRGVVTVITANARTT